MIEVWMRDGWIQAGKKRTAQVGDWRKRREKYEKRAREQGCDEECTNFLEEKLKNVTLFSDLVTFSPPR